MFSEWKDKVINIHVEVDGKKVDSKFDDIRQKSGLAAKDAKLKAEQAHLAAATAIQVS